LNIFYKDLYYVLSLEIKKISASQEIYLHVDVYLNGKFLQWIIEKSLFYNLLFNGPKRAGTGGPNPNCSRAGPKDFGPLTVGIKREIVRIHEDIIFNVIDECSSKNHYNPKTNCYL